MSIVFLLIAVQGTFLVSFDSNDPDSGWTFPDADDLAVDHHAYLGEEVVVYGLVEETEPVRISHDLDEESEVVFTVTGIDRPVREGQYLEVYAVARPDGTLEATNVVVVPGRGHWYAYGISLLGGLWTFARFLRHWRFDLERLGFTPDDHGGGDA